MQFYLVMAIEAMKTRYTQYSTLKPLLAGGLMFVLVGVLIDVHGGLSVGRQERHFYACQGDVRPEVSLSKEQVAEVLTIPERGAKQQVRGILSEPYCMLPDLEIRSGVKAEREAYPLAFDPNTWLVVLYEGEEYAGYRFSGD
ncbi:MAG: hypothetical protein VKK04_07120 [Synechococcales bacterium]|nr:hypothetical protein [Synechococcales bacterium]